LYETVNTYGTRIHQQLEAHMADPLNEFYARFTSIVDRSATTAVAFFDGLTVSGSSKRAPEDEHLPEVGRDLAFADLFEKLSVKLRKRAQGRVNTFENDRKQRRASAARKAGEIYVSDEIYVSRYTPYTEAYREAFATALDELKKAFGPFPS
jgi:hypothetical protein